MGFIELADGKSKYTIKQMGNYRNYPYPEPATDTRSCSEESIVSIRALNPLPFITRVMATRPAEPT